MQNTLLSPICPYEQHTACITSDPIEQQLLQEVADLGNEPCRFYELDLDSEASLLRRINSGEISKLLISAEAAKKCRLHFPDSLWIKSGLAVETTAAQFLSARRQVFRDLGSSISSLFVNASAWADHDGPKKPGHTIGGQPPTCEPAKEWLRLSLEPSPRRVTGVTHAVKTANLAPQPLPPSASKEAEDAKVSAPQEFGDTPEVHQADKNSSVENSPDDKSTCDLKCSSQDDHEQASRIEIKIHNADHKVYIDLIPQKITIGDYSRVALLGGSLINFHIRDFDEKSCSLSGKIDNNLCQILGRLQDPDLSRSPFSALLAFQVITKIKAALPLDSRYFDSTRPAEINPSRYVFANPKGKKRIKIPVTKSEKARISYRKQGNQGLSAWARTKFAHALNRLQYLPAATSLQLMNYKKISDQINSIAHQLNLDKFRSIPSEANQLAQELEKVWQSIQQLIQNNSIE